MVKFLYCLSKQNYDNGVWYFWNTVIIVNEQKSYYIFKLQHQNKTKTTDECISKKTTIINWKIRVSIKSLKIVNIFKILTN